MDAPQPSFLLEAVDHHRRRVRHLVAQLAEDLLAHALGREEALVAIGELVGGIEQRRWRQQARDLRLELVELRALFGRHRHDGREVAQRRDRFQPRQQRALVLQRVDLVDGHDDRQPGR